MKNLFVNYELSLLANNQNFDEPCLGVYYSNGTWYQYSKTVGIRNTHKKEQTFVCTAPTHQQLIDWFRNEHKIHIYVEEYLADKTFKYIGVLNSDLVKEPFNDENYKENYYDALNDIILDAFKLISK